MNYNSEVNQGIKRQFVEREVIYCVSSLVHELCEYDNHRDNLIEVLWQTDFENACLDSGYDELPEEYSNWQELCDDKSIIPYTYEALEHWIVSDWLAEKLEQQGEMVTEYLGLTIWGRCTSGQSILLDYVISKICEDLQILEGQEFSWAKYENQPMP